MVKYSKEKGFSGNLEDITESFILHHRKKGSEFKDWYAAWQQWLRNEINPPWNKDKTTPPPKQDANIEELRSND